MTALRERLNGREHRGVAPPRLARSERPSRRPSGKPARARTSKPWLNVILDLLCCASIVAAVLLIGLPSTQQPTQSRIVTAERGVVQSMVSGSGSLAPAQQASLNFKTSGRELGNSGKSAISGKSGTSHESGSSGSTGGKGTGGRSGKSTDGFSNGTSAGSSTTSTTAPNQHVTAAPEAANLESAEASVESAEVSVTSAQDAVDETKLYAPFAGAVAAISGAVGDTVSENDSSMGALLNRSTTTTNTTTTNTG